MQNDSNSTPGHSGKPAWRFYSSKNINTAACTLALVLCNVVQAQDGTNRTPGATNGVSRLSEIVVEGREESLIGVADSAAQGTVGATQLERRTLSRPAEILETVPGVIVTQHSGSGKANQYFLRGFNLDHGTDFATSVDGMPVNLPSHGHGQGYTDLNFVIPELVRRVNYRKGVYYADSGDFSSAGAADMEYFNVLPTSIATLEGGSFGYGRALFASSPKLGPGNLLYALEATHSDGPWTNPDDFQKFNGALRYSLGDESCGYSLTALGYHGGWDASDQVPNRAVDSGAISRWDAIDPTSGGESQRYSLNGEWHRQDADSATKIMGYGFYYDLDLFSNFTYFLTDDLNGDQFHQHDDRWVSGAKASHTWFHNLWERDMETSVGLQLRHDNIHNGLFNTVAQNQLSTVREDDIAETSLSPYVENKTVWTEKVRSTAGLRADFYHFDVDSELAGESGTESDGIVSPKLGLVFGPWAKTEYYVNGGLGFHSNDGRGVTSSTAPADPLVRTYGAEVGARTTLIPNLQSTLSLWWLDIDSELLFVGDAGSTDATRPSRRYGVELGNYYTPTKWLTIDADFSLSKARFRDDDPAGNEIPGSIETVVAAGITFHDLHGFFGGLRLRYFGPRPLLEDDSIQSGETILVSAHLGYQFNETWTLTAEVFNLLDRRDSEIDYFYTSRLPGEPAGGVDDIHFHSTEPISFRVALTAKF